MNAEGLPLAKLLVSSLTKATPTTLTVPVGHRYYLAYWSTNYVADATVATRIVTLYIDHGTPETHLAKFDITASQNMRHIVGGNNAAYAAYLIAGVLVQPNMPLVAGDVVCVGVSNGQAGDAWTARVVVWDVVLGA